MKRPLFLLIRKQNIYLFLVVTLIILLVAIIFSIINANRTITVSSFPEKFQLESSQPDTLAFAWQCLNKELKPIPWAANGMEPETPQDMNDPPFYNPPLPSKVVPITEVIAKGNELPLEFIYNDSKWKRKAYKEYWHSTFWRWSYVPNRLHYALHRIFTTYQTASIYYDFVHNLGIAEESDQFKNFIPIPTDKTKKVNPFEKLEIVVMNSDVKRIFTYGNQVVLISEPRRTGLQALIVPMSSLNPFNADENLLVQLATSDGNEIDYSLISIAKFNEN